MAERVVIDCDRCGAKGVVAPVTVHVQTGRSSDPAGGWSTPDTDRLDLCASCAAWAFGAVAKKLSFEDGAKLVSEIKLFKLRKP